MHNFRRPARHSAREGWMTALALQLMASASRMRAAPSWHCSTATMAAMLRWPKRIRAACVRSSKRKTLWCSAETSKRAVKLASPPWFVSASASNNSCAISACPRWQARCSAVTLPLIVAFLSARASRSKRTTSKCFSAQAMPNGVAPPMFGFVSAPEFIKKRTTSTSPWQQATDNGAKCPRVAFCKSALASIKILRILRCPCAAARARACSALGC